MIRTAYNEFFDVLETQQRISVDERGKATLNLHDLYEMFLRGYGSALKEQREFINELGKCSESGTPGREAGNSASRRKG